jgi:peptidyl-dipeptidase Dcp
MKNPLLESFETAPFSKIKNEHFLPAFKELILRAKKEIDTIASQKESPTFKNTIEALDYSGMQLDRVSSIFYNLNSAETNDEIQKIAQEVSPILSEFKNDLLLNELLFKRVKKVYQDMDQLDLDVEQKTLLERQYKGFFRNGALLSAADKESLRSIDKELAKLKLKFGENVLAENNAFELHITNEDDISGLPDGIIEMASQTAIEKNKEGWIFTLDYPSYIPFITYADNRELRKEMAMAFGSRGFQGNEYDNRSIVLDIVKLRHERALLLGYRSHAHFILEERMAKTPDQVQNFLNDLLDKTRLAAQREFDELSSFAKASDGIEQIQKWDGAYYSEKLKQERFQLDDEILKPYFKLDQVIDGVFKVSNKLFGLQFNEIKDIDVYHPDVKTYAVSDENGEHIAILYADFHPRPGKRGGAWMTSFKPQYRLEGKNVRPHISIVCNFSKPTHTKPALMTFNEVTTLFHEFGHALHGMLANTTYKGLSGTNVFWDFVELPSQIFENWCYEKEALELFARHYEDGNVIPMELVEKIKETVTFQEGIKTLRQLSFGMLDMAWHSNDPSKIENIKDFEKQIFSPTRLYPDVESNCMSTSFSHIFQGGYSAGYYSYKWAEVLDADAFTLFKEKGIFNQDISRSFKENILSRGGTEDPMELYVRFRGSKPNPNALLKRAGLLKE